MTRRPPVSTQAPCGLVEHPLRLEQAVGLELGQLRGEVGVEAVVHGGLPGRAATLLPRRATARPGTGGAAAGAAPMGRRRPSFFRRSPVISTADDPARAEKRRDHRDGPVGLVHRTRHAVLQHRRLGSRVLLGEREGARGGPPPRPARAGHRPDGRGRGHPRARHRLPLRGPLPGRAARPGQADQRVLRPLGGRAGLRRPLLRRLPDQGEPDARGGRRDRRRRRPLPLRAGGRLQGRAAHRAGDEHRPRGAHHLQRLQGRRLPAAGAAGAQAGAQGDRGHREALRAAGAAAGWPRRCRSSPWSGCAPS